MNLAGVFRVIQGWVKLKGATDGTMIGNVSDRLKVDAQITGDSSFNSNSATYDAFNRARVSNPKNLFDCSFYYNLNPSIIDTVGANGGTITHENNKKSAILATTATEGSSAIMQTLSYFKYHAARSNFVVISGNLKGAVTNVVKRVGQFDDENGFFFQLDSTGIACVIRSKVSGSVVDNIVYSTSWNILNPSLDYTKQQIFFIDYQWLGSGRVRFGQVYDGKITYVHAFSHANYIDTLYSQTATLPLRFECVGNAIATMEISCMCVATEGQDAPDGLLRTISTGVLGRNIAGTAANFPLISLRKQTAFTRIPIDVISGSVFVGTSDDILIKVVKNATLTGASWVNASIGFSQYDISSTAYTGGTDIYQAYLRGASTAQSELTFRDALTSVLNGRLGRFINGNSEIITVSITNITSTSTVHGAWTYKEII